VDHMPRNPPRQGAISRQILSDQQSAVSCQQKKFWDLREAQLNQ
jgi:hypothetical protein